MRVIARARARAPSRTAEPAQLLSHSQTGSADANLIAIVSSVFDTTPSHLCTLVVAPVEPVNEMRAAAPVAIVLPSVYIIFKHIHAHAHKTHTQSGCRQQSQGWLTPLLIVVLSSAVDGTHTHTHDFTLEHKCDGFATLTASASLHLPDRRRKLLRTRIHTRTRAQRHTHKQTCTGNNPGQKHVSPTRRPAQPRRQQHMIRKPLPRSNAAVPPWNTLVSETNRF